MIYLARHLLHTIPFGTDFSHITPSRQPYYFVLGATSMSCTSAPRGTVT